MGTFATIIRQYFLMLRKDSLVLKGRYKTLLVQIFIPFFFVLLVYLLQLGDEKDKELRKTYHHYDIESFPTIPRCNGDRCYTIAYAPTGDPYDSIVSDIASWNSIPSSEVIGFTTQTKMDTYIYDHKNKTQAGYIFDSLVKTTPTNIAYTIMYNESFCLGLFSCVDPVASVVVPMQYHMDRRLVQEAFGSSATLQTKIVKMPRKEVESPDAIGESGPFFFFAAFMFHFVVFQTMIVEEKERKLKLSMTIMGLRDLPYWLSWMTISTVVLLGSIVVLILSGVAFGSEFFTKNSFFVYFFLFFLTGEGILMMGFFLSVFLRKINGVTRFGVGFFIFFNILGGVATNIVYSSITDGYEWIRVLGMLFPPIILSKGINDLVNESGDSSKDGISWSERGSYTDIYPMTDMYRYAMIDYLLYALLLWYCNNVVPQEWGTYRPLYFFLMPSYWGIRRKNKKGKIYSSDVPYEEDADVSRERKEMEDPAKYHRNLALRVQGLTKIFRPFSCFCRSAGFKAVDSISFGIDVGHLVCLLGPNGAGKTTTFNMLTGVFAPTTGTATMEGGITINDDLREVQKKIGVCPQHDVLWEELTGEQHLRIFAILKGIPSSRIENEIDKRLEEVHLHKFKTVRSGSYSGGMRRRLSVAISLVGDPPLLYLDEPTTGMDPIARRQVWDMLIKAKEGRTILLTTHSMEEADVLGDRIVIMAKSRCRCVGSSLRLKNKFGSGFRVAFNLKHGVSEQELDDFVHEAIEGQRENSSMQQVALYLFPRSNRDKMVDFFRSLETHPKFSQLEYSVSMATLEEVFLRIAADAEKEAAQGV